MTTNEFFGNYNCDYCQYGMDGECHLQCMNEEAFALLSEDKNMTKRYFKVQLNDIETGNSWTIICDSTDGEKPIIKFYDAQQHNFPKDDDGADIGQFVASYYITTILQHHNKLSLNLSEPSWTVSHHLIQIIQFLIMKII